MSSVILDLQRDCLNANSDIVLLLRKALLISHKLELGSFREWINKELHSYKNNDTIPEYRFVNFNLKRLNHRRNWVNASLKIPEIEEIYTRKIFDSIIELQYKFDRNDRLFFQLPETFSNQILQSTGKYAKFSLIAGVNMVNEIIENVKTAILEWAIILEKNGIIGENLLFDNEEKNKIKDNEQITNYIINIYGNENSTLQIQQGTKKSIQKIDNKK